MVKIKNGIFFILITALSGSALKCKIENERIYCKYFIDRSDNKNGKKITFYWKSPSGKDDRKKTFWVPPNYGSVYDYRYLMGREAGKWEVEAKEENTEKKANFSFTIDKKQEWLFEE